jgi:hypothetical protein
MGASYGMLLTFYHEDNGISKSKIFSHSLTSMNQQLISGVGAHHQNGVAEWLDAL